MKIILYSLMMAMLGTIVQAGEIRLADGHIVHYSPDLWEYALSENTFKKSIGLLEAKDDQDIRGIIDTEVRFVNASEVPNAESFLAQQCADLKEYWDLNQFEVVLHDQSYCIVRSKTSAAKEMALYQVLQAKVSQSRKDMIFVYSWTFHVPNEKFELLTQKMAHLRRVQR